ncbi:MAG TPA: ABC transporter ATP-binding protein [Thermoanaerobaculaceae bacterium]|nr:ABC transporter ATP-binding protein [Thermoanaerobaculaceae bacterium]HRS15698.1 ABC transporter ATP-binding protein [Thermoanaerobaculaceae bacterium]
MPSPPQNPEPASGALTTPPKIAVIDLWKAFRGKEVLRGVDLEIVAGESFVILGGSGAGKSVLLKHLIGLIHPDRGHVVVDGEDIACADPAVCLRIRRKFGMSFQEGALFDSMNVFENIAFPLRRHTAMTDSEIARRVHECLELVNLDGVGRKATSELSGGMRRRVGFARAIALQPEILLFDEPNTGLDPLTSAVIDRVIVHMRESLPVTMVTITHDMRSAFRIADRIAMLRDGRILAVATPDEFRRLPDPYIQSFLAGEPLEEEVA